MPHEEFNDALKRNNVVALQRYEFAIKCLGDRIMIVADVGCGCGYGSHLLTKAQHQVIGLDKLEEAITYSKQNYPGAYYVWDVEKDGVDEEFDVVVCLEVLCQLKEPQKFIDGLKCKELIVSAPIDPDPNDGYQWRLHNLSEKQFREILKDWQIVDELRQKRYLTFYCKKA